MSRESDMKELFCAAVRVDEEAIELSKRPTHDGTPCVLVPERIFQRLRVAVVRSGEWFVDWRPK